MSVQSLHRLQCLVDLVHEYVLVISVHGTVAYVSPTLISILNLDPASLPNTCILSFLHPNDAALLQASLLHIHQQRSSLTSPSSTNLSSDHILRFIHTDINHAPTTTCASCHIRPFALGTQPSRINSGDSSQTPFTDDFDPLFHPLMTGFRGSGRVTFPPLTSANASATPPSPSPADPSNDQSLSLTETSPDDSDFNSPDPGANLRSDLYLLLGRSIPAGPHDAILDDLVPTILLNRRLRASLFRRYQAIGLNPTPKSADGTSRDDLFIPSTSVLRENTFDPILMAAAKGTATTHSPAKSPFLLPDCDLTHAPPPLALSFGWSGVMIPNPATSAPSSTLHKPSAKTSITSDNNSNRRLSSTANQFLPAAGHGSGLAGFISPSDFVDANIMSIKGYRHGSSVSSSSTASFCNESRTNYSPVLSNASVDRPACPALLQPARRLSSKRKRRLLSSSLLTSASKRKLDDLGSQSYVCMDCGTNSSPEWRRGPTGEKCLCNACGLRFAKRKKLERDAASSTPLHDTPTISEPIASSSLFAGRYLSSDAGGVPISRSFDDLESPSPPTLSIHPETLPNHSSATIVRNTIADGPLSIVRCADSPDLLDILEESPISANLNPRLVAPSSSALNCSTDNSPCIPLNSYAPYLNERSNLSNIMMLRYHQQEHANTPECTDVGYFLNHRPGDQIQLDFQAPSPTSVASLPSLSELIGPPTVSPSRSISESTQCDDRSVTIENSGSSCPVSTTELSTPLPDDTGQHHLNAPQWVSLNRSTELDKCTLDSWWKSTFSQPGIERGTSSSSLLTHFHLLPSVSPLFASIPAAIIQPAAPTEAPSADNTAPFEMGGYLSTHTPQPGTSGPSPLPPVQVAQHEHGGGYVQTMLPMTQSTYHSHSSCGHRQEIPFPQSRPDGTSCGTTRLPKSSAQIRHDLTPADEREPSPVHTPLPVNRLQAGFAFSYSTPPPAQTQNTIQYLNNLNALNKEKRLDAKQRAARKTKPKKIKKACSKTPPGTQSSQPNSVQQAQSNLAALNNATLLPINPRRDSCLEASTTCSTSTTQFENRDSPLRFQQHRG